jgi:hypothetical protein
VLPFPRLLLFGRRTNDEEFWHLNGYYSEERLFSIGIDDLLEWYKPPPSPARAAPPSAASPPTVPAHPVRSSPLAAIDDPDSVDYLTTSVPLILPSHAQLQHQHQQQHWTVHCGWNYQETMFSRIPHPIIVDRHHTPSDDNRDRSSSGYMHGPSQLICFGEYKTPSSLNLHEDFLSKRYTGSIICMNITNNNNDQAHDASSSAVGQASDVVEIAKPSISPFPDDTFDDISDTAATTAAVAVIAPVVPTRITPPSFTNFNSTSPASLARAMLTPYSMATIINGTRLYTEVIQLTAPGRTHELIATGGMLWSESSVDCYNTITKAWSTEEAKMPISVFGHSVAIDPNTHFVYVFGTWSIKGRMCDMRRDFVVCWIPRYNGFMILGDTGAHSSLTEFYSPTKGTSIRIPPQRLSIPHRVSMQSCHLVDINMDDYPSTLLASSSSSSNDTTKGTGSNNQRTMLVIIAKESNVPHLDLCEHDESFDYWPSSSSSLGSGAVDNNDRLAVYSLDNNRRAGYMLDISAYATIDDLINQPLITNWQMLSVKEQQHRPRHDPMLRWCILPPLHNTHGDDCITAYKLQCVTIPSSHLLGYAQ